ncbi:calcium-binding tyrosine phosphorylation-regulated protein isoform X1 [Marmota monax]|uniref:calcium-binding tyrosine phosphorylation-regulated protein isoform X1 n=1 Tax=Marmota monax TaxID=9995 RepID=UPI001EAFB1A9|nr:calcium-binding tyrosine phosphorylation-regulated protein isoform X1 [Marmota monax]XP_058434250.1 calcium-binding tyrosine phosphorylation-regulated protein isoform X1 [Marmota monax]XP_058434251.1 calcium-binding tyrosine phosphorylation-regulated protein isoform X1 [Marmota monax]XP_058434252.1 calcium-binding tyrosine phosphorylation-regulated protein isoform X1 [Marmota monax]
MLSSKPRLVVPYGLKTLLEGVSRAVLKTKPSNITQFAAIYFKELIVFREGNNSLDIKDLIKQFHQLKVEKWSEGVTQEKKSEPERTPVVSQEPTRMEKSTDTEEDNISAPQFSNKTTQFPSINTECPQTEGTSEAVRGPSSKPVTPKTTTPPSSPSPAAVSAEFAYVPADPAQFATQMLGNVSSIHSDQSDILMVDVATSMPVLNKVLKSEIAEEVVGTAPLECSGEPVQVDEDYEAELPTAFSIPLQAEQHPPAYDQAPKVPLQADDRVTTALRISSIYNNQPVAEGIIYVEQIPEHIVIPFTDQVACLKGNGQLPSVSPKPVQLKEDENFDSSINMEAEATFLLSDSYLEGYPKGPAESLDAEGFIKIGTEQSLHVEVEITSRDFGQQTSLENLPSGYTAEV